MPGCLGPTRFLLPDTCPTMLPAFVARCRKGVLAVFFGPEMATRSERKRKGWQRDIKRGYQRWIVWTDTCFVQYIKIIQNHQILAINFSYVLLVHDPWLGGHDFMATSFTGSGKFGPPSQLRWWNVRGILALLGFQSFLETDRCRVL